LHYVSLTIVDPILKTMNPYNAMNHNKSFLKI
jgi:hypothetical protein